MYAVIHVWECVDVNYCKVWETVDEAVEDMDMFRTLSKTSAKQL